MVSIVESIYSFSTFLLLEKTIKKANAEKMARQLKRRKDDNIIEQYYSLLIYVLLQIFVF